MPYRRLSRQDHDKETTASPKGTRLFVLGVLTAVLLGLVCGLVWTVWNLLRLHLFR